MPRERNPAQLFIMIPVWIMIAIFMSRGGCHFHQEGDVFAKRCGKCGRSVSMRSSRGDSCPHCGVYWSNETSEREEDSWAVEPSTPNDAPLWGTFPKVVLGFVGIIIGIMVILDYIVNFQDHNERIQRAISWVVNILVFSWLSDSFSKHHTDQPGKADDQSQQNREDSKLTKSQLQEKYGYADGTTIYHNYNRD